MPEPQVFKMAGDLAPADYADNLIIVVLVSDVLKFPLVGRANVTAAYTSYYSSV